MCGVEAPAPMSGLVSKGICISLLVKQQTLPKNWMFRDDLFEIACRKSSDRNEAVIIRDIALSIVTSAQSLATYRATHLEQLRESVPSRMFIKALDGWLIPTASPDSTMLQVRSDEYCCCIRNLVTSSDHLSTSSAFLTMCRALSILSSPYTLDLRVTGPSPWRALSGHDVFLQPFPQSVQATLGSQSSLDERSIALAPSLLR